MEIKICIQGIANAPKDREIFLIDVMADTPRWGAGIWIPEAAGFFDGYRDEHDEMLIDVQNGDHSMDDYECCFWAEPTHWCDVPPIPLN